MRGHARALKANSDLCGDAAGPRLRDAPASRPEQRPPVLSLRANLSGGRRRPGRARRQSRRIDKSGAQVPRPAAAFMTQKGGRTHALTFAVSPLTSRSTGWSFPACTRTPRRTAFPRCRDRGPGATLAAGKEQVPAIPQSRLGRSVDADRVDEPGTCGRFRQLVQRLEFGVRPSARGGWPHGSHCESGRCCFAGTSSLVETLHLWLLGLRRAVHGGEDALQDGNQ